ncbi:hypothetical protein BT63DRAFT_460551 [Microthyrium microscopicum]|uniref:LysM domain-containing protein n=1 Tax=Microthyrium microscopicum TaxID=703497 RepID=A0A6A6TZG2_9PEZI|nr:hypothetical protein BT63DRAFT_460551 [Microthyrium microscopicum]
MQFFVLATVIALFGNAAAIYKVKAGEDCYTIATSHGLSLDTFRNKNRGLNCGPSLQPGADYCV